MRTAFPHVNASAENGFSAAHGKAPLGDEGTNYLRWKLGGEKINPFGAASLAAGAHSLSQDRLDVFLHSSLIRPKTCRNVAGLLACCNQEKNLGLRL
nr:hypothetical protein [Microvirga mediterraneensis]